MPSPPGTPTAKKDDSLRKINKPLMERRRRERINNCLSQLKHLVVDSMRRETTQISKLEKADILEMTVSYLRAIQRQQPSVSEPEVRRHRYRAGYNECANKVMEFISSDITINDDVKSRLGTHLIRCSNAGNQGHSPELLIGGGSVSPSNGYGEQLTIHIPDLKQTTSGTIESAENRLLLPISTQYVVNTNNSMNCNTRFSFPSARENGFSNGYFKRSSAFVDSQDSSLSSSAVCQPGYFESNFNVVVDSHVDRSDHINNNNDNVWRPW